jgi:hypothetical protein
VALRAEIDHAALEAEILKTRETVRGKLRVNVDPLFSRVVLSPKLSELMTVDVYGWAPNGRPRLPCSR